MKKLFMSFMLCLAIVSQLNTRAMAVQELPQLPELPQQPTMAMNTKTNAITQEQQYDGPTKTKSFSKTFALDNSDKVSLANKYGSILIKTWDKNEVKVDVSISAFSNTEADAQKLLDEITIDAGKSGDVVNVHTVQKNRNGNFGTRIKNGRITWRREIKVIYTVYMPATNAISASQQYGNIDLGDFSAPTSFKVQYGNLTAGVLSNSNNYVNVQYGKSTITEVNRAVIKHQYGGGITINRAGSLDLDVQYAQATISTVKGNVSAKIQYGNGLNIGSADNLTLDAQYVKVKVDALNGNATIKQQYGNLNLGAVGKLNLQTQYTGVTLGRLNGDAMIDMDYDRLNISGVTNNCKILSIKGSYTNISVDFGNGYNARLDVQTDYASLKAGGNVLAKNTRDENDRSYSSKKNYVGKVGNGGSNIVKITSDYGAVNLR